MSQFHYLQVPNVLFMKHVDISNICELTHLRYKPSSASSETVGGAASNAVDGVATIVHEVKKTCFTKQLRRNVCQLYTNFNISGSKVHRNEKRAVAVVDGGSALCTGEKHWIKVC